MEKMEGRIPWLIFDADNTLWAVEHLYDQARESMCAFLGAKGASLDLARIFQLSRDKELYETYGYSACRFARSFEDSLFHFFPSAPAEDVRHVRRLALDVFEQPAQLADGLDRLLELLSPRYHLGIITAGERWVQERRLSDFHLRHLFAAIEIVESKNESVFRAFCARHLVDPGASYVIGDSFRSDILPARAAGLRAIWCRSANWDLENAGDDIPPDVLIIARLAELTQVLGLDQESKKG
jgi:putative hydrolase of the HAD superfamily